MDGERFSSEWIDERVVRFLEARERGSATTPEQFVRALEDEDAASPDRVEAHRRLLERLRSALAADRSLGAPGFDLAPGSVVGDFRLLERLGEGGMGVVFRARQESLGREVALKVPHWSLHARERGRFDREIQAVAQLRHPAVVPLFEAGELEGRPYFAMELVPGRPLSRVIADVAKGRLPREGNSLGRPGLSWERAVAGLGREVLDGLEAAHAEGIVHRDLKPSNLVVQPDGRARILDFGLARFEGQEGISGSREIVGTPDYFAPELLDDPRAASVWSDVYAVGLVLYELLTLAHPFRGTPAVALARIQTGDPTAVRRIDRRVPRPLSAIVEKATARSIERRYPTAAALADDLARFLDGRDVTARAATPLERLGRRMQRHPAASLLALVLALVLGALMAQTGRFWEVLAASKEREARELFRSALLYEYEDAPTASEPTAGIAGRETAIELLEEAMANDGSLVYARIFAALLCIEIGEHDKARTLLAELPGSAGDLRAVSWIESAIEGNEFVHPPDDVDPSELADPLELYLWARSRQRRDENLAGVLAACQTLGGDALFAPAAWFVAGSCFQSHQRRQPHRAARNFQAALATMPDHPTAAANLAYALQEAKRIAQKEGRPPTTGLPTLLEEGIGLIEPAFEAHPEHRTLRLNYGYLLAASGRTDEARSVFLDGVSLHADGLFAGEAAETLLDEIGRALAAGETVPDGGLPEAQRLLEHAWAARPDDPRTARRFAFVHYYRCVAAEGEPPRADVEKALTWARKTVELGARWIDRKQAGAVESWALGILGEESAENPDAR